MRPLALFVALLLLVACETPSSTAGDDGLDARRRLADPRRTAGHDRGSAVQVESSH